MKKIIVLLIFGLMIFGCLGPAPPPTGGGTTPTGNGTTPTDGGTPPTGGGTSQGTISTYAAAAAAGLPLTCTVTSPEGQTTQIFIKGNNMYMAGSSGGQPFEIISKGDTMYSKLSDEVKQSFLQAANKSCDWIAFTQGGEVTTGTPVSPPADTGAYTGPAATWSCSPGLFGDEKFTPVGNSCTMEDLTSGYAAQIPPG